MTDVVLVTALGCHFCADARARLAELGAEFPLRVRELDAASQDGLELVERHRPGMWPLVLVDGTPFSSGRLPAKKLRKVLERTVERI